MEFRRRRRIEHKLEITPLIDVVLLLLIFFMVSTTFVVQPGIKVNLPKASAEGEKSANEITVIISKEGDTYFEDKKVDLGTLKALFKKEGETGQDPLLIIKADKEATHGKVVQVMDLAKTNGIGRLAIATSPRREGEAP